MGRRRCLLVKMILKLELLCIDLIKVYLGIRLCYADYLRCWIYGLLATKPGIQDTGILFMCPNRYPVHQFRGCFCTHIAPEDC